MKMHNLQEFINIIQVNVYVIQFSTYDLIVPNTDKNVTLFQRNSMLHISYFHSIPEIGIQFLLTFKASN